MKISVFQSAIALFEMHVLPKREISLYGLIIPCNPIRATNIKDARYTVGNIEQRFIKTFLTHSYRKTGIFVFIQKSSLTKSVSSIFIENAFISCSQYIFIL